MEEQKDLQLTHIKHIEQAQKDLNELYRKYQLNFPEFYKVIKTSLEYNLYDFLNG